MTDQPTVAVVGAGFSGLLTALRLLLNPDGPRVVLIEKGPRFGRGAAYATGNPDHLLNVRATNMSALVEQPNHFLDWLGAAGVAAPDRVFVTRDRYGQYLQSLLRETSADRATGRLTLEHDEVTSIAPDGERWRLSLAMGRNLPADAVVLALGNLPPPPPPGLDPALLRSDRYVGDPWAWEGPTGWNDGEVLILGTGLTAIDIALSVDAAQPQARMSAMSRHGLLPHVHGDASPTAHAGAPGGSPKDVLAEVRRRAAEDWRGAVDSLRPHIQSIWRGWSVVERRRFLRHAAAWWNIHRHRMAPEVATRIQAISPGGASGRERWPHRAADVGGRRRRGGVDAARRDDGASPSLCPGHQLHRATWRCHPVGTASDCRPARCGPGATGRVPGGNRCGRALTRGRRIGRARRKSFRRRAAHARPVLRDHVRTRHPPPGGRLRRCDTQPPRAEGPGNRVVGGGTAVGGAGGVPRGIDG